MDKFVIKTKRKCEDIRVPTEKRRKHNESQTERGDQGENNQETIVATTNEIVFRTLKGENLNCEYCRFLSRSDADNLLKECESTLSYNTGDLAKVHIYGKWLDIPRQQVQSWIRELLTWSSYSITSKVPSPAPPHHLMSQVSLLSGTN